MKMETLAWRVLLWATCAAAWLCVVVPMPARAEVASYYGAAFEGRLRADGGIFRRAELVAAHRTLPFGTRLRVTNLANGKSVIATVRDRGPFVRGRDLDLSEGAFRRIASLKQGLIRVVVERL